jgi:hypothetical protein
MRDCMSRHLLAAVALAAALSSCDIDGRRVQRTVLEAGVVLDGGAAECVTGTRRCVDNAAQACVSGLWGSKLEPCTGGLVCSRGICTNLVASGAFASSGRRGRVAGDLWIADERLDSSSSMRCRDVQAERLCVIAGLRPRVSAKTRD